MVLSPLFDPPLPPFTTRGFCVESPQPTVPPYSGLPSGLAHPPFWTTPRWSGSSESKGRRKKTWIKHEEEDVASPASPSKETIRTYSATLHGNLFTLHFASRSTNISLNSSTSHVPQAAPLLPPSQAPNTTQQRSGPSLRWQNESRLVPVDSPLPPALCSGELITPPQPTDNYVYPPSNKESIQTDANCGVSSLLLEDLDSSTIRVPGENSRPAEEVVSAIHYDPYVLIHLSFVISSRHRLIKV